MKTIGMEVRNRRSNGVNMRDQERPIEVVAEGAYYPLRRIPAIQVRSGCLDFMGEPLIQIGADGRVSYLTDYELQHLLSSSALMDLVAHALLTRIDRLSAAEQAQRLEVEVEDLPDEFYFDSAEATGRDLYIWHDSDYALHPGNVTVVANWLCNGDFSLGVHNWAGEVYRFLVDHLDAGVLDLLRAATRCITVAAFNFCMQHAASLRQLRREAGLLFPVLFSAFQLGLAQPTADAMQQLKRTITTEAGARVWRMLYEIQPQDLEWLNSSDCEEAPLYRRALYIAAYAAACDVMPRGRLFRHLLRADFWMPARCDRVPLWFKRAAALASHTPGDDDAFMDDYLAAVDWVTHAQVEPDANQRRAGWTWIVRQSLAWHEEQQVHGVPHHGRGDEVACWESAMGSYCDGFSLIQPLTSAELLREEGTCMHHCVGAYTHDCAWEGVRIFSIRTHDGVRVATAEIARTSLPGKEAWRLVQVKGPRNMAVTQEIQEVAEGIAFLYAICDQ